MTFISIVTSGIGAFGKFSAAFCFPLLEGEGDQNEGTFLFQYTANGNSSPRKFLDFDLVADSQFVKMFRWFM